LYHLRNSQSERALKDQNLLESGQPNARNRQILYSCAEAKTLFFPPLLSLPLWSRNIYPIQYFEIYRYLRTALSPLQHEQLPPSYLFKAIPQAQNPSPQRAQSEPVGLWKTGVLGTSNVGDHIVAFRLCLFILQAQSASSS